MTSSKPDTQFSVANKFVESEPSTGRSDRSEFDRTTIRKKSKHSLRGKIIRIHRGLALYQTHASPYYFARVLDRHSGKYIVRSTKEVSRLEARRVAEELELHFRGLAPVVPREFTFADYAERAMRRAVQLSAKGEINANYARTCRGMIENKEWGLFKYFGRRDVRQFQTRDYQDYIAWIYTQRPDLSPSTLNGLTATFRNVLKIAREDGAINAVPATPRPRQRDNPRAFFRFAPLVAKQDDEYQRLLDTAAKMAKGAVVRGIRVTDELYDLIEFVILSFVRPISTELYALRHSDVTIETNPQRLLLTIRNGKTGFRIANTMPNAVTVFGRIQRRYPDAKGEDFLFMPHYKNRVTAARIIQRWFNDALERANLKFDPITNSQRSLYCLRHTAICQRIILSDGKVNIYNLAKNAGTSVNQIERFYARNLPLSREMARNLQVFGR